MSNNTFMYQTENLTFAGLLNQQMALQTVETQALKASSSASVPLDQDPIFLKTCEMFWQLKEQLLNTHRSDYLPTLVDRATPITAITDLYFLTLCAKDPDKNIFPNEQAEILQRSAFWDKYNAKGLKYGLIPVCAGIGFGAISFVALASGLTPVEQISTATAISLAGGIFSTVVSFLVTGIFPDKASETHNDRQDAICALKNRFKDLGTRLIDMFFSEAHASLAYEISLQLLEDGKQVTILNREANLYKIASQQGLTHQEIIKILKTLDYAVEYITKNKILRNAHLEALIDTKRKKYEKKHQQEFRPYRPPSLEQKDEIVIDINDNRL